MLQAIGQELIEEQSTRDGLISIQHDLISMDLQGDATWQHMIRVKDLLRQAANVDPKVDHPEITGLVQGFMDERHGDDAVLDVHEHLDNVGILDRAGPYVQQA
jgi:hypothetical protein